MFSIQLAVGNMQLGGKTNVTGEFVIVMLTAFAFSGGSTSHDNMAPIFIKCLGVTYHTFFAPFYLEFGLLHLISILQFYCNG